MTALPAAPASGFVRARLCALACLLAGSLAAGVTTLPAQVTGLKLTERPVAGTGTLYAVLLTGDGGFADLDQGVSAELTARGIPVVGFDQRAYLWSGKTPEQAGADLARVLDTYRAKWHRDTVVVIGYSRGAGIAPFAVNRLPVPLRGTVKAVALIGAAHGASFRFHLRDLVRTSPSPDDVPVMPELRRLGATTLVCFYGEEEKDTLCPELPPPAVVVKMPGGHHLDGAYEAIGRRIAETVLSRR